MISTRSPRSMFWGQVLASIIACTVQLGVQAWMFTNIEEICSTTQKNGFSCPNTQVFGTASIIWGVIGPARQFSQGQIYYGLVFFFLVGFLAPLCTVRSSNNSVFGLAVTDTCDSVVDPAEEVPQLGPQVHQLADHLQRYRKPPPRDTPQLRQLEHRRLHLQLRHPPPSLPLVDQVQLYVERSPRCRRAYCMLTLSHETDVLSAALDSGLAIGQIVIFFTLLYPDRGQVGLNTIQAWWGNTVQTKTADFNRTPLMSPPAGDFFGYVNCTLSRSKFAIDDVFFVRRPREWH